MDRKANQKPDAGYSGRGNRTLRLIDRYAGIPLVFIAGALRRKKSLPLRIERIGVLNTAAMGDTILQAGVIADLRAGYPSSSITYFAGETNYAAACLLSGTDSVVRLPVRNPFRASRMIRERALDVLLDTGPWPRINAIITLLSGAKFSVGFRVPRQHRHYGYDVAVEHSREVHELENHRRLVAALGVKPSHIPRIDLRKLPSGLSPNREYMVFHLWPGGTCSSLKEWPVDRWIRLAEDLTAEGYDLFLTGAPSQSGANDFVIEKVDSRHRSRIHNAAGLKLEETAGLVAGARLVVSVDTGVMHLAAALRVRLVALHGPSSSTRWGPISDNAVAIDSPLPGSGYLYLGFEQPKRPPKCMDAISYERVLAQCLNALQETFNASSSAAV